MATNKFRYKEGQEKYRPNHSYRIKYTLNTLSFSDISATTKNHGNKTMAYRVSLKTKVVLTNNLPISDHPITIGCPEFA